eukprot:TRINITY_DN3327_c0_g1_i1.p1 TRINITY_DN3327_c0_g1~~TRINITY_DN3327_c0_g1_i1.p1  ORF type:complete len:114 (+),score=9.59 TRINITY_DN3327_c0_g1_i1:66-407(+)
MYFMFFFFFFQAEDGIRDHAQSRGLGDVYKRQPLFHTHTCYISKSHHPAPLYPNGNIGFHNQGIWQACPQINLYKIQKKPPLKSLSTEHFQPQNRMTPKSNVITLSVTITPTF